MKKKGKGSENEKEKKRKGEENTKLIEDCVWEKREKVTQQEHPDHTRLMQ